MEEYNPVKFKDYFIDDNNVYSYGSSVDTGKIKFFALLKKFQLKFQTVI
jgi:hypothetical protein